MKWITVFLIATLLSGCETIPQRDERLQQAADAELNAKIAQVLAKCRSDWENDERIDPVREKLPLNISSATFQQLNDKTKPTNAEKQAIIAVDEVREKCNASIYSMHAPDWPQERSALMRQYMSDSRAALGALWNGDLTYGQFLTSANKTLSAYGIEDQKIANQYFAEAQRARNEKRTADAAMFRAYSQFMEANKAPPVQIYQPVQSQTTNCTAWAPGKVQCVTR